MDSFLSSPFLFFLWSLTTTWILFNRMSSIKQALLLSFVVYYWWNLFIFPEIVRMESGIMKVFWRHSSSCPPSPVGIPTSKEEDQDELETSFWRVVKLEDGRENVGWNASRALIRETCFFHTNFLTWMNFGRLCIGRTGVSRELRGVWAESQEQTA